MNTKFFLTIVLSFGCATMIFMWYSANSAYKESQLTEKQYLFKISFLESENKMELKLIESLRVDISKNEEDLKIKSNLLKSLHLKQEKSEEKKLQIKINIDKMKKQSEKLRQQNNLWLDNWKAESQNISEINKNKLQMLESKLKSLQTEYNNLNRSLNITKVSQNKKQIRNNEADKTSPAPKGIEKTKKEESQGKDSDKDADVKVGDNKKPNHVLNKEKLDENGQSENKVQKAEDNKKPNHVLNNEKLDENGQSENKVQKAEDKDNIGDLINKKRNDMQARAPIIKKKMSVKKAAEDYQHEQEHDRGDQLHAAILETKKNVDKISINDDHANKENMDGQLRKPNLVPINRADSDIRPANPKILKKVGDLQVKPPILPNIMDRARRADTIDNDAPANDRPSLFQQADANIPKKKADQNKVEIKKSDMLK